MTMFLVIAGALAVLAVLLSAVGGDTNPVVQAAPVIEESRGSRIDLTVTMIMLVILLLGVVLLKITP